MRRTAPPKSLSPPTPREVDQISLLTAILKTDNPLQIIVPVGKNKMAADQVSYRAKIHRKARFLVHVKDF